MARWGLPALGAALALSAAACGGGGKHDASTGNDPGGGGGGATPLPVCDGTQTAAPGSWPVCNASYGAAAGILETPVVAITTDESQNRWVATMHALYLLRPGDKKFTRFDENSGLHLGMITGRQPGPVGWDMYCNQAPALTGSCPAGAIVMWGGAALQGITSLAGGRANEVFVGYGGTHSDVRLPTGPFCPGADYDEIDWCDPYAHSGKIDWVRLQPDGTLSIVRFDLHSTGQGGTIWHNRLVYRLAFDHSVNRGSLYAGTEHGVDLLFPDRFRDPKPGEDFDVSAGEYMGDHLHAEVCLSNPPASCAQNSTNPKTGTWKGLAIDGQGRLWHAGLYTAGRITWDPNPLSWKWRDNPFDMVFGDPYLAPGNGTPPAFEVASEGQEARLSGVAVCPDGKVWFSTEGPANGPAHDRGDVLASWDGTTLRHFTGAQVGLQESSARDVACLPDGRVVVAGFTTGLSIYDPATGTSKAIRASSGVIPSDAIRQIEVDRSATPATLQVATDGGAAALRVLP